MVDGLKEKNMARSSFKNITFIICLLITPLVSAKLPTFKSHIHQISEDYVDTMRTEGTYQPVCPVPPHRLRIVEFSYVDFEGKHHNSGKIMVLDAVAESVAEIFQELYAMQFPIHQSKLLEYFHGDDINSLNANNTASYNCRLKTDEPGLPSIHSYGLAIDINPIQNPYFWPEDKKTGVAKVHPGKGLSYINRTNQRPGMVEKLVDLFKQQGFSIWGGNWNEPIDWQHFQPSRTVAQLLAEMNTEDAKVLFNAYKKHPKFLNNLSYKDHRLIAYYKQQPQKTMQVLTQNLAKLDQMNTSDAFNYIQQQLSGG